MAAALPYPCQIKRTVQANPHPRLQAGAINMQIQFRSAKRKQHLAEHLILYASIKPIGVASIEPIYRYELSVQSAIGIWSGKLLLVMLTRHYAMHGCWVKTDPESCTHSALGTTMMNSS